jgi:beta-alanine--pyruvate transaminase
MTDDVSHQGIPSGEGLDAYWMPFTANRQFKRDPRMIVSAEGVHYRDDKGRRILDCVSGLWCTGAGHNRPEIADAVSRQLRTLEYAPAFQFGHPLAFELAERIRGLTPDGLDYVFLSNSGSESVESALKIARAYWRQKGQASKTKLIGRARGYHGVNYGGISVGGIGPNRRLFGAGIEADHLPHTVLPENAFTRGLPQTGAHLADELLNLIALHDASNIAAVIVEPMAGSAGVLPPPAGYLQRLREICTEHDILLIFDEVISGLGRCGGMTCAELWGVTPDMLTLAKQLTNGAVPLGATVVSAEIHDAIVHGGAPHYAVELPHGYTYSGHPVACAAALAALDILESEDLCARVQSLAPEFENILHELRGSPHLVDIRNVGFTGGLQLDPYPGEPGRRSFELGLAMWEKGFYVRAGVDTVQLGPAFVMEAGQLQSMVSALGECLAAMG